MYIKNKIDLLYFLEKESKKYGRANIRMPLVCIREKDFLWKHNILLRKTEYYVNTNNKIMGIIYKIRLNRFQNKHQIHIPINVFDAGLKIMHLGPILVNGKVKAGRDISMHMNTSIVAGGSTDGVPKIGNNIVIGVGTTIVGDIEISDNIAIGANSLVNKNFLEKDVTIAGVPAKIISYKGRDTWGK